MSRNAAAERSDTVMVAVVDGVPDLKAPALVDRSVTMETSLIPPACEAPDDHGTDVCGLIFDTAEALGDGATPLSALALPIFFSAGPGQPGARMASQLDLARALNLAVARGASIVNVSAGQRTSTADAGSHLEDALAHCEREDVLVIAAVGNDGCACLHVPAAVPTVLAVGAMDADGRPHDSSNWGDSYGTHGLMAPGVGIALTDRHGRSAKRTGTSYATAIVSGVAAHLLHLSRQAGYDLRAADIRAVLIESADPCVPDRDGACERLLAGRLNIAAAIRHLHDRGRANARVVRSSAPRAIVPSNTVSSNAVSSDTVFSGSASSGSASDGAGFSDFVTPSAMRGDRCPAHISHPANKRERPMQTPTASETAVTPSGDTGHAADPGLAAAPLPQGPAAPMTNTPVAFAQSSAPQGVSLQGMAPSAHDGMPAAEGGAAGLNKSGLHESGLKDTGPTEGAVVPSQAEGAPVEQSGCGCGGGEAPQTVYALGALWFDFGTEARYDAIVQAIGDPVKANTPAELIKFLSDNLEYAGGITFILMQDQIPLYAIQPAGTFAVPVYKAVLGALSSALDSGGDMQRVSVPGIVGGTTRLMNGMTLPVLVPDLRGMYQWKSEDLVSSVRAAADAEDVPEDVILNFLARVYDELRNLGTTPQDRAINFAATNAYQAATVFRDCATRKLELFAIRVAKSPICRPDSDCWDVHLQMFDPENDRRAGRIYRFTVDVSETLPVTVGPIRSWAAPLSQL
ncbi:PatA/PatG family cyanobactin maturation protease [Eilatimonas milleporae]|uniref:Cyanobactin maturation PatA/PatG family protease n=1 Tax=Eilatimonas milleporae TaxID=911205 RepID=A0A3M0CS54_9PROT|nr:PatA/PatG family cyanobactin maturation protease [Eilatimonas milleporae]RMB12348.1 cyanobactin maturation PatA/PatG family protease [Eilatimonas milleporae]